jgi:hypothetical protein
MRQVLLSTDQLVTAEDLSSHPARRGIGLTVDEAVDTDLKVRSSKWFEGPDVNLPELQVICCIITQNSFSCIFHIWTFNV